MSNKSEIGHFARIPLHVAHADISETAKGLWRELAFVSSPQRPQVWVRQESFAEKLNKCVKTVQRALKELTEAGLIKFAGWYQGRYKTYKLAWKNFFSKGGQECPTSSDTDVVGPQTSESEHVRQESPTIIREAQKSNQQNNFSSERIAEHVQKWQEQFKCLDGKNGRPSLKECIDHGLAHKSRHNYDTPWAFLDVWLRTAAGKWLDSYHKEISAAPSTPESRQAWQEMRDRQQEEEFARYWPKIQERDRKRAEERRIELGLA